MSATEREATRPAIRMLTGVTAAATLFLLPGTAAAAPDAGEPVPPDRYRIASALTGQCLALGAGVVELADCGSDATAWDIVPAAAPEEPAPEEPTPEEPTPEEPAPEEPAPEEPAPEEPAPEPEPAPDRAAGLAEGPMLIRNVLDCVGADGKVSPCGEGPQGWLFQQTDTGDFTIASAEDGMVLAVVPAVDETSGDTVHTTENTGETNEVWLLEAVK